MSEVECTSWHLHLWPVGSMGPRIIRTTTIGLMPCHGVKRWETPASEDCVYGIQRIKFTELEGTVVVPRSRRMGKHSLEAMKFQLYRMGELLRCNV